MNERIRELWDKAAESTAAYHSGQNNSWETQVNFMDKFAELIVRECADICINENVSNIDMELLHESGKFTVQDLATKSCGENLAKQIKKHFGVEE